MRMKVRKAARRTALRPAVRAPAARITLPLLALGPLKDFGFAPGGNGGLVAAYKALPKAAKVDERGENGDKQEQTSTVPFLERDARAEDKEDSGRQSLLQRARHHQRQHEKKGSSFGWGEDEDDQEDHDREQPDAPPGTHLKDKVVHKNGTVDWIFEKDDPSGDDPAPSPEDGGKEETPGNKGDDGDDVPPEPYKSDPKFWSSKKDNNNSGFKRIFNVRGSEIVSSGIFKWATDKADFNRDDKHPQQEPTFGSVHYVDEPDSLFEADKEKGQGKLEMSGEWTKNDLGRGGFKSFRLETKQTYPVGAVVLFDAERIATGVGTLPAYWSNGAGQWPDTGEIDLFECLSNQNTVHSVLHTGNGVVSGACDALVKDESEIESIQYPPGSCNHEKIEIDGKKVDGYGCGGEFKRLSGPELNQKGGALHAYSWTKKWIKMWRWERKDIPEGLRWLHLKKCIRFLHAAFQNGRPLFRRVLGRFFWLGYVLPPRKSLPGAYEPLDPWQRLRLRARGCRLPGPLEGSACSLLPPIACAHRPSRLLPAAASGLQLPPLHRYCQEFKSCRYETVCATAGKVRDEFGSLTKVRGMRPSMKADVVLACVYPAATSNSIPAFPYFRMGAKRKIVSLITAAVKGNLALPRLAPSYCIFRGSGLPDPAQVFLVESLMVFVRGVVLKVWKHDDPSPGSARESGSLAIRPGPSLADEDFSFGTLDRDVGLLQAAVDRVYESEELDRLLTQMVDEVARDWEQTQEFIHRSRTLSRSDSSQWLISPVAAPTSQMHFFPAL